MIELKVHCDCGQKFKFDVEPVNYQMPFTVACPICHRDGTPKANAMLQQMAVFKPVEAPSPSGPAVAPPPLTASALPPIAPAPIAPPPPVAPSAIAPPPAASARLRVNAPAHTEVSPGAPPPIAAAGAPPTIGARPRPGVAVAATAAEGPGKQPNFALGLLGALVGAAAGSALYFFIYKTTGYIPFLRYVLALGVGGLTGFLANLLGRGEGSKELGGLAAVFTLVGIIGAQYILQLQQWHKNYDTDEIVQTVQDGGYTASVKESKQIIKAIPTGSDAEIRMYIAKQQVEDGQAPKLETVTSDEVKQFRETELTNYQDLASGKLTKEQYWANINFDPKAVQKNVDIGEKALSGVALVMAVFKAGIVSMIVGAGLAFKLSTNAHGG